LIVTELYEGGPGARAGLREGDVITAIDGAEVNDQNGLNFRVGTKSPNDTAAVTIIRDGSTQTINARVQTLPGDAKGDGLLIQDGPFAGAEIAALNPALADRLGGDPFATGLLITRVQRGSYAARAGLRPGDLVREVNGRTVTSPQALARLGASEVTIERQGRRLTGVLR
jgi:S1-C subfamily serine protease